MISVDLNESEYKSLMDPKWRRGITKGGFQNLMIDLCNGTDKARKRVYLNQPIMKRMRRYAFNYSSGGWEDGLLFIFGRTLGQKLDRYLLPEDEQPDLL